MRTFLIIQIIGVALAFTFIIIQEPESAVPLGLFGATIIVMLLYGARNYRRYYDK